MKTRFFLPILYLLSISLFFTACKKDPTKNAELPPITQEGENTVGFIIDGEVWLPYYECRFMGNPCGEIHASNDVSGGAAPNAFDFQILRQKNNKLSALTVSSSGTGTITTVGNKIDSISVDFQAENWVGNTGIFGGPLLNGNSKFIITKIDYLNQIISGEFNFDLIEQNGSGKIITIKDGRFDFKFNACKCSR